MKLQKQILLMIFGMIIISSFLLFVFNSHYVLNTYKNIEIKKAYGDINEVFSHLERREAFFKSSVLDWSIWDDTYNFVTKYNEEYISRNYDISTSLMEKRNLSIIISRREQKILFSQWVNLVTEKVEDVPIEIYQFISRYKLLEMLTKRTDSFQGYIHTSKGLLFIVAAPIYPSIPGDNYITNGVLIMGRLITPDIIKTISNESQVNFYINKTQVSKKNASNDTELTFPNNDTLVVTKPILDVYGNQIYDIIVRENRYIYSLAITNIKYFSLTYFIFVTLLIISCLIFLNKIVINPLKTMSKYVHDVDYFTYDIQLPEHICNMKNEIGQLAKVIKSSFKKITAFQAESMYNNIIFDNISDGFVIVDRKGIIKSINSVLKKMLEFDIDDVGLIGQNILDFLSDKNFQYNDIFTRDFEDEYLIKINTKSHIPIPIKINVIPLKNNDVIVIVKNMSELKSREEKILHAKYHDILTGLPNKYLLIERFMNFYLKAKQQDKLMFVLMGDVDKFKLYSNNYGRTIADKTIKNIAYMIHKKLDDIEFLSKTGDDTFVVIKFYNKDSLSYDEDCKKLESIKSFEAFDFTMTFGGVIFDPKSIDIGTANIDDIMRMSERIMLDLKYKDPGKYKVEYIR